MRKLVVQQWVTVDNIAADEDGALESHHLHACDLPGHPGQPEPSLGLGLCWFGWASGWFAGAPGPLTSGGLRFSGQRRLAAAGNQCAARPERAAMR
jgi:hypothetical protein